jgi:tRNA modification GTPase
MLSDPIVALATPPGRAALAVIRLSGDGAFDVAARVVSGFRVDRPRRATLAPFRDARGRSLDQGLYTVFPRPESYTGEDMVELSCHGGLVAPAKVIAALAVAGARQAFPGEFTRRAVLNGKMDLVQAEGVGDLVDATAPQQARLALQQLDGALSRKLERLRDQLVALEAMLSYDIDFPEEDDGPLPRGRVHEQLERVAGDIDRLLATAPAGERIREGALVVFAGRPNTGKSSLFNSLLGLERAIVTDIPGTTRDAIESSTEFDGWPVHLVDTAGLRAVAGPVERLGIEVSHRYLAAADLVLLCIEAGREFDREERTFLDRGADLGGGHGTGLPTSAPILPVRTKADLVDEAGEGIPVSVMTGEGLDRLKEETARIVFSGQWQLTDLEPALTRERHRDALHRSREALAAARPFLTGDREVVLAAHHVREAVRALDELIGVVDIEEVLDRIFASFCVGK